MKRALVCGAGGFIGSHLVKKLKKEGYWVRGVDIKKPEFAPTAADEFLLLDLREKQNAEKAVSGPLDEVYQLAADMGGMGFIHSAETRDHAQQRPHQHQHDPRRRRGQDPALLLFLLGLRLPGHEAGRAGDDRGRRLSGPARQRVRLGEALLRADGHGLRPALRHEGHGSPVSRTATAPRAPGPAAARRPRPPSAARSPGPRWRRRSRSGATARRSGPTPTSTTWSTASTA